MDDSSFQFAQPVWIAVGAVATILGVGAFLRADRRRRSDLDKLAHPRFHDRLVAGWSPALRWTRRVLWLAAVVAVSFAAARPQFGYEWREVKRRGIDILFAVDTSRSMLAEDLVPNRLERSRMGILDFLDRLEGDRVGLVPFAGTAFALCPLTLDYDAFRESLSTLNTDLIPRQGTDLASAIHEAGRLFDAEGNNQRFLVLITDGEDLEGEALNAAEQAAADGTTIYTVGVGAVDGQMIPIRDRYGRQQFLKDESGEVVRTKLDVATLEKIAASTGGLYVPLGRGAEGLEAIYEKRLSMAPKSELAQKLEKIPLERYQWPLGAALLMLAVQAVVGERKREGKKQVLASAARRVKPVAAVMLAGIVIVPEVRADVVGDYNDGTQAYAVGEFEEAVELLKESLATPDLGIQAKAYYNLGNSLYRIGQGTLQEEPKKTIEIWEKSIKAYEDALALDAADEDAQFNRDLVQRKLDELKKQQNQKNPEQNQDQQDQQDQQDSSEGEKGEEQKQGDSQENQEGEQGEKQDSEPGDEGEGKEAQGEEAQSDDGSQGESSEEEKDAKLSETEEGDGGKEEDGMKGQEAKKPENQEPTEGEVGEAREAAKASEGDGGEQSGAMSEGRQQGVMSREEAIRLLETLGQDERLVLPAPLYERDSERGRNRGAKRKTW